MKPFVYAWVAVGFVVVACCVGVELVGSRSVLGSWLMSLPLVYVFRPAPNPAKSHEEESPWP